MFNNISEILYVLPGIILGLTVHEFCHAFAAYKLGDSTARDQGRLTFNPLKHIDPIGFLFIIFARFGWAKPVQFNPANLKHFRRDKAIIAACGPLSNFFLAVVFIYMFKGHQALTYHSYVSENWDLFEFLRSEIFSHILLVILHAIYINLGLFVFNLIPLPPLDGSHIVFSGLNIKPETEYRLMKIGMPVLFLIIIIQNWTDITILPIGHIVYAILGLFL